MFSFANLAWSIDAELEAKSQQIQGVKKFKHVGIDQVAIVDKEDPFYKGIYSKGATTCVILSAIDKNKGRAFLAHITADIESNMDYLNYYLEEFTRSSDEPLKWLIVTEGSRPNLIEKVKNHIKTNYPKHQICTAEGKDGVAIDLNRMKYFSIVTSEKTGEILSPSAVSLAREELEKPDWSYNSFFQNLDEYCPLLLIYKSKTNEAPKISAATTSVKLIIDEFARRHLSLMDCFQKEVEKIEPYKKDLKEKIMHLEELYSFLKTKEDKQSAMLLEGLLNKHREFYEDVEALLRRFD
jgi:hypothetical protein